MKKIGPIKKRRLLEYYKTPKKIWEASQDEIKKIEGIGEKLAQEICDKKYRTDMNNYIKNMIEANIELITIQDSYYPKELKNIYDYPVSLYVKGDKTILNSFNLAIVGSRDYTNYGRNVTEVIAKELVKRKITVTSGMAIGIDAIAHKSTLENGGKTIAALGSGLLKIYPPQNVNLYDKIYKNGGVIISEYPIDEEAVKLNFPTRNRIISGISNGIIVSEARARSGSLITVDFGLEQGKNIFAVPGNITNVNSEGTNNLIKDGAKMVTNIQDIIEEYKEQI